jgi:hypothetical protein
LLDDHPPITEALYYRRTKPKARSNRTKIQLSFTALLAAIDPIGIKKMYIESSCFLFQGTYGVSQDRPCTHLELRAHHCWLSAPTSGKELEELVHAGVNRKLRIARQWWRQLEDARGLFGNLIQRGVRIGK